MASDATPDDGDFDADGDPRPILLAHFGERCLAPFF